LFRAVSQILIILIVMSALFSASLNINLTFLSEINGGNNVRNIFLMGRLK